MWKQKNIARAIAMRPDLQILAAQPDTLYSAVKQAGDDQRSANTGTGVHRFAEDIDDGMLDWQLVPDAAKPYLEHYAAAKERHGWSTLVKELTVFNMTVGYAGTPDRIMQVDGRVAVCDIKTGSGVWPDVALQLAAYANAEGIWTPSSDMPLTTGVQRQLDADITAGTNLPKGRRKWSQEAIKQAQKAVTELYWQELADLGGHRPMPEGIDLDVGYVIHATADACDLVPISLGGAFDALIGLTWLFAWESKKAGVVGQPIGDSKDAVDHSDVPGPVVPESDTGSGGPAVGSPGDVAGDGSVRIVTRDSAPSEPRPPRRVTHGNRITETLPEFGVRPYRDWLVDRLKAWPAPARALLADTWPKTVPTFKQSVAHDVGQLDEIRAAMQTIADSLQMMDEPYSSDYWRSIGPADETGGPVAYDFAALSGSFLDATQIATDADKAEGIATFTRLIESDGRIQYKIVDAMKAAGVHKNLRKAEWTMPEWATLVSILAEIETQTKTKETVSV